MAARNYLCEAVGRHLSAASALLSDAYPHVCKARQAKLSQAARALNHVRQNVAWSVAEAEAARKAELNPADGVHELTATAAARAQGTLEPLELSPAERRFANNLGELVVGLVYDAFEQTERQALGYDAACIPAAVAVALAIVTSPPPPVNGTERHPAEPARLAGETARLDSTV